MKILKTHNVPNSVVVKVLSEIQEKGFELGQLALRVNEYSVKFNKCDRGEELVEALVEMGLKEITAVLIANIVPKDEEELRALTNFEAETPEPEKMKEILGKVQELCS